MRVFLCVFALLVGLCGSLSVVDLGPLKYLNEDTVLGYMVNFELVTGFLTEDDIEVVECDLAIVGIVCRDNIPTGEITVWLMKDNNYIAVEHTDRARLLFAEHPLGHSWFCNKTRGGGRKLFIFQKHKLEWVPRYEPKREPV